MAKGELAAGKEGAVGKGRPVDSSSWPSQGPGRRFAELLDRVRRENGMKSLRTVAAAMSLQSPSRVSELLRMKTLPADGSQARMLVKALGGSAEDIERGLRLYRMVMSAPGDTGRAQLHGATTTVEPVIVPAAGAASLAGVRRTLPRDIPEFAGREEELRALLSTVTEGAENGRPVLICAIEGMAGIGKTTLAVHAAHMLGDRFPDRQLFVNLHGHTPGREPVRPDEALAGLLTACGVDPRFLPADLDGRAGMWRDRVAGQRALLVLDNAAGSSQVAPLLPGGDGCLVLVTSRRHLGDLPGAVVSVLLDMLRPPGADEMFTRLAPRAAGNPDRVAEVVRLAGFLPLAISLLARVYTRHQSWTLEDLAAETRTSLLAMTAEDESIAAAFAVSYRQLDLAGQRFFCLLGLQPGGTIDAYAAAALARTSADEAAGLLDGLHGEGLLTESGYRRYAMHDLLRRYARDHSVGLAEGGQEALERLLDYYQHAAALAGARLARQTRPGIGLASVAGKAATPDLSEARQALAWVRADRASLLACLDQATRTGQDTRMIALTAALAEMLRRDGPWTDAIARHGAAAQAARRLGDRLGEANALTDRGTVQRQAGIYPGAVQDYEQARSIFYDLGDRPGQANALTGLGTVQWLTNDYRGALRALEQALAIYRDLGDQLG
jgi:tetratricopeptide (TPR) repeat protein